MQAEALTRQVIGCFFTAYNAMGFGLPESFYSAALEILFRDVGLEARREHRFDVMFASTSSEHFASTISSTTPSSSS
jgi:GxxExxY protein